MELGGRRSGQGGFPELRRILLSSIFSLSFRGREAFKSSFLPRSSSSSSPPLCSENENSRFDILPSAKRGRLSIFFSFRRRLFFAPKCQPMIAVSLTPLPPPISPPPAERSLLRKRRPEFMGWQSRADEREGEGDCFICQSQEMCFFALSPIPVLRSPPKCDSVNCAHFFVRGQRGSEEKG